MSGICLEKIRCLGKQTLDTGLICKGNKQVQVFGAEDGSVSGFCFACDKYIADPYGEPKQISELPKRKEKSPEQIQEEIAEIDGYQTLTILSRKLREETLAKFGAKVSVSERDGTTPTAIYWPVTKNNKLSGYHVKPLWEGGFPYFIGDGVDCDLIGWEQAKKSSSKRLIITEGPEDMASVDRIYEMYGKPEYHPAVVSLPRGAGSARSVLQKHSKEIRNLFREIVFCFDDDEAGHNAVKAGKLIIQDAKSVTLGYKDANEALVQGAAKKAYTQLSFAATTPKTSRLVFGSDLHEIAREPAKWGELSWPFPRMNDLTRGIRYGETVYIGAGVKMGKGELRNELAAHFMREHGIKVFMASFEEANKKSYKMLAGKLSSTFFHDPKIEFNYEAYDEAGKILKEQSVFVDLYQSVMWENTKDDIKAAAEWGAKAFFIDPITNYTAGMDAGSANTFLTGMAREASSLAMDLGLAMFLFCHLKAPEGNISQDMRQAKYDKGQFIGLGNCPHEAGGTIYSSQFAGSRAMMQSCNMMCGLQGNKDPDLAPEQRNMRELVILEDREFGVTGKFPVYWNEATSRFSEC